MDDAVRQVEEYCAKAGMKPDAPLRLALITVVQAAEVAREAAGTGARGLTPEGEAELVRRVAKSAEISVAKSVGRTGGRLLWGTSVMVGVVVATVALSAWIGGYWWGRSGAQAEMLAQCSRYTVTLDDGRKACAVPLSPKR